jgi:cell shape-determining protein MreC
MQIKFSEHSSSSKFADQFLPIICIGSLYLASYLGLLNNFRFLTQSIVIPIREGQNLFLQSIKNEYSTLVQATTMRQEIEKLKEENVSLQAQLAYLITVKEENKELHAQLKLSENDSFQYTPVRLISAQGDLILHSPEKLQSDQHHMLISQNTLCAVATAQEQHMLKATSLQDYSTELPVMIVDPQAQGIKGAGIIRGYFGTTVLLDKVTQDVQLQIGYQVLLQPNSTTPANILVGTVSEVQKRESDIFQHAYLELACSLSEKHTLLKVSRNL